DNVLVTFPAGLFCYLTTARRDVNVVFIPAGREVIRMPETISRLGRILADESGWRVAIIANRHCTMTRLQPTAKLILHDMTIHARFSVVSHVRIAARVDKRVSTHADGHTNRDAQNDSRKPSLHAPFCAFWWLLFRVTLDALEHRDVSQVDRVFKRLVRFVASLALAIRQPTEIDRMLKVYRLRNTSRSRGI